MIVIGRNEQGYYYRVESPGAAEWVQGETIFQNSARATDALSFAIQNHFPVEYLTVLVDAIRAAIVAGV